MTTDPEPLFEDELDEAFDELEREVVARRLRAEWERLVASCDHSWTPVQTTCSPVPSAHICARCGVSKPKPDLAPTTEAP